jgi:lysophospholipid acyltransferase (LPLAT)-like uncharacterized protein
LRSEPAAAFGAAAIAGYIRLVETTSRFEFQGRAHADGLLAANPRGFILAFWHERLMMAPLVRRQTTRPVKMLISPHADGALVARAVKGFGVEAIAGSASDPKKPWKNRAGAGAVAALIAAIGEGAIIGVTPDGPTGPRRRAKPGVIRLAAMSGAPIIPAASSVSNAVIINSWDRFMLALPFSKGAFVARPPIRVAADADADALEEMRRLLESELNLAAGAADAAVGRRAGAV